MKIIIKLLIFLVVLSFSTHGKSDLNYELISSKDKIRHNLPNKVERLLLRIPLDQIKESDLDRQGKVTIFLELPTTILTHFYLMDEDTIVVKEKSFMASVPSRDSEGAGFIPSITIDSKDLNSHNLIISLEKPKLFSLSFSALPHDDFRSFEGKKISYALLYLGGAISVGLLILCFGLILRDISFIYYFFFLFFITPISADIRGIIHYLSSGLIIYSPYIRELSVNLSFAFCLMFTFEYFKVTKKRNALRVTFLLGVGLFVSRSLLIVFDQVFDLKIGFKFLENSYYHFLFLVLICVLTSLSFLKEKRRESLVYIVTWGAFFFFAIIWSLALLGVIHFGLWINGVVYLGFIFQSFILMFGVWNLNHIKELSEFKARESVKLKNLIRVLCHDSINLLNVALVQSDTFKNPKSYKKEESILAWEKVNMATKDQIELLSHIREMDALDSGKRVFDLGPVDINSIIEKSIIIFEDALCKKNISIKLDLDSLNPMIHAEKVSVANNVINNLISNAIKFSFSGDEIVIRTYEKDGHIVFSIKDTGVGMSKELIGRIFNPSEKTTRKGTSNESGTGFGMPLVKSTVDAYNAQIHIESREGESSGTLFKVEFIKSIEEVEVSNLEKRVVKKVILIDDDEGIRELCHLWFKKLEIDIQLFSSFEEASEKVNKTDDYDLCLVDKNLENEDGLECLTDFLKINSSDCRYVLMSADIINTNHRRIEFLEKPLNFDKISELVKN